MHKTYNFIITLMTCTLQMVRKNCEIKIYGLRSDGMQKILSLELARKINVLINIDITNKW
jgi:hypothetical protein